MQTIRQGDITGFDDAEVLDVEDTEDTYVRCKSLPDTQNDTNLWYYIQKGD